MTQHRSPGDRRIAAASPTAAVGPDLSGELLLGDTVHDVTGHHIGTVTGVQPVGSASPRWITVSKGLVPIDPRAVPLHGAGRTETGIQVAVGADLVDGAPDTWMSRPIDATSAPDLFLHYAGHLGGSEPVAGGGSSRHACGRP